MHPSGQQLEIVHGDLRAVVVELGGGLRCFDVGNRPVVDGYAADAMATGARGQPLIPWPNRLHTGRYRWDGRTHTVPLDEPEQHNAIHGLTRWRNWTPDERSTAAVTMRLDLLPTPPYPFALDLAVRYELGEQGLSVTMSATNRGGSDAPFGCGAHPYVTVGGRLDDASLHLPASTWLPTGPAQIPVGRESVQDTPWDFRTARRLDRLRIDHAYTDLARDAAGRARLTLTGPDGRSVQVWADEGFPYLEVFTGDTVPEVDRRRQGLGVEPMTCPPDAFRSGTDLIRLRPGQTFRGQWGISLGAGWL